MITIATHEASWSKRKIVRVTAVVFAAQLAFFWLMGREPKLPSPPPPSTAFHFLAAHIRGDDLFRFIAAPSPDILSLPSTAGFSGAAWLSPKPIGYELPQWEETPQWLQLQPASLGKTFVELTTGSASILANSARPAGLNETFEQPTLTTAPPKSSVQVVGDLAARLIPKHLQLKSWTNSEPLLNTVVEIAADRNGDVVSARITERSGNPQADQSALEIARATAFKITRTERLTFGKLVFTWQTFPSTTNEVPSEYIRPPQNQ